jgi:predicted RND superfamily exporter protein
VETQGGRPVKVERAIRAIARFSARHPWLVLGLALCLGAGAVTLAATRLTLRTSNLDLIDPGLPPVRQFLDFAHEFGTPNVLVIVLEGEAPSKLEEAVMRMGPDLRAVPGVRSVIDRLPLDPALLESLGVDAFVRSRDGRVMCVFVQPDDPHSSAETLAPFVRAVRDVLARSRLDEIGVRAGLTGLPAYALDDRDIIQRDIARLSIISFALIVGLFVVSFHAFRRPVMAMLSLASGLLLTVGFSALYPGHLTLLSAFFVSILFGLCDDFGIQTVGRVEELVRAGRPEGEAVVEALASLARGLVTGTLTTAAAFYSAAFSGFKGFAELGIIAGTGSLLCLLATVTVLPALLTLVRPRRGRPPPAADHLYAGLMARLQHRGLALALGAGVLAAAFSQSPGFDTDYLNLEPCRSEAVRLERVMVAQTDVSPQFAVFTVDSIEKARSLSARLRGDTLVGQARSAADLEALAAAGIPTPDLPESYRRSLVSPAGRFAVYAYPQGDVWEPRQQQVFIDRMRAIDPAVTGMPFLGQFMVGQSQRGMRRAAALAGLVLVISVFLDFRAVRPTALALLPTALTLVSLRALMRLCHVMFNPLNIMAIPVILGLAVSYGVHIVHRFVEERGDLARTIAGTGRSVVLSALTTLIGFGALIFTEHRGLASFAVVMTLGLASALAYSVVVLPAALSFSSSGLAPRASGLKPPVSPLES